MTNISKPEGVPMTTKQDLSSAGLDFDAVSRWLCDTVAANGGAVDAPLHFRQIPGGRSNLTFEVTDASGRRWALRRPPTGHVLPSAHDMVREHLIMSALGETDVPVPTMTGLCTDHEVTGTDFFVMEWVDGHVVRTAKEARGFELDIRHTMAHSVIDNMAKIHQVDIDEVGLGNFAKRTGYLERQLRRWKGQVDATESHPPSVIGEAFDEISARLPTDSLTRLVHGDYRLDNTIVDNDGNVIAVLDWELTTLGDPLADVGAMLCYWARPNDDVVALTDPPTLADGFLERDEVIARYEREIGRPIGDVGFYHAFATWRLACILHGVVDRYRAGTMGDGDDFDPDAWEAQVEQLASMSLDIIGESAT